MKSESLFKVLQLDSLINILSWQERWQIHEYLKGKPQLPSKRAQQLHLFILQAHWVPPLTKFGQDRLLYFFWKGEWHLAEHYIEISKIKINEH